MDSLSEAYRYTETETETINGNGDETDTETKTKKKTETLDRHLGKNRALPKPRKGLWRKRAGINAPAKMERAL